MSLKTRAKRRKQMAKSIDYWRQLAHQFKFQAERMNEQQIQAVRVAKYWKNKYEEKDG